MVSIPHPESRAEKRSRLARVAQCKHEYQASRWIQDPDAPETHTVLALLCQHCEDVLDVRQTREQMREIVDFLREDSKSLRLLTVRVGGVGTTWLG